MSFDWDELRQLKAEGYLAIVPHPEPGVGLWLLNYTKRAQFQAAWEQYPILLGCRGTIVTASGAVVARGFRKFFNVGERPETAIERLAALGSPEVAHKLDGSLAILYPLGEEYRLATRGSFASEQAVRATAIWQSEYAATRNGQLDRALTYLFEYVAPDNRIVVRYDRAALILIGLVVTATGEELAYREVRREGTRLALPYVEEEAQEWRALHAAARENFEGFVLFWPEQGLRAKVKLAEYVRLHRIYTGLSEQLVWEYLRTGSDLAALRAMIPEEVLPWLEATIGTLHGAYAAREAEIARVVGLVSAAGLEPASRADRKAVAEIVVREGGEVRAAVFAALDGKAYRERLWALVEPQGREPIRLVEEE
jgi:RNA ligase